VNSYQKGLRMLTHHHLPSHPALAVLAAITLTLACPADAAEISVADYGAAGDGKTLCTAAIQKAIDACASQGGGSVRLPAGKWLSGTVLLKSHVTLYLEAGCTLLGSADPKDYPENRPKIRSFTATYTCQSLLFGENLDNIAIRGRGTIDGQGCNFKWAEHKNRPYLIRLVGCRDVLVEDVHLRESAMWMQHYLACDRVPCA
jgi:polygalacturonase